MNVIVPPEWTPAEVLKFVAGLDHLIVAIWDRHGDAIWAYLDQQRADAEPADGRVDLSDDEPF